MEKQMIRPDNVMTKLKGRPRTPATLWRSSCHLRTGSLDGLLTEASRRWDGGRPYIRRVWHPGDAHSYVEIGPRIRFDMLIVMRLVNRNATGWQSLGRQFCQSKRAEPERSGSSAR